MKTNNDRKMFAFENLYDDGEYYWFTVWSYNALFRMDKKNWLAEYMGSFSNAKLSEGRLYEQIIEYDNKLYFTPGLAKSIGVYDKKSGNFSNIDYSVLQSDKTEGAIEWDFYSASKYNGCIYFFPHQKDYILKLEVKTGKIMCIPFLNDDIQANSIGVTWFFGICVQNNIVYAPFNGVNAVLKLDMSNDEITVYEVGDPGMGFADICFDGEDFWLAPMHSGVIVRWNDKQNISEKIELNIKGNTDFLFCRCEYFNDRIYLIPNTYDKMLTIETQNNNNYCVNEYIDVGDTDKGIYYSNYICCNSDNDHILLLDKDLYLSEIDKENKTVRYEQVQLNPENENKYNAFISKLQSELFYDTEQTNFESSVFPLKDYIKSIIK